VTFSFTDFERTLKSLTFEALPTVNEKCDILVWHHLGDFIGPPEKNPRSPLYGVDAKPWTLYGLHLESMVLHGLCALHPNLLLIYDNFMLSKLF
jgi:hypothetical protein